MLFKDKINKFASGDFSIVLVAIIVFLTWTLKISPWGLTLLGAVALLYSFTCKSLASILPILLLIIYGLYTSDVYAEFIPSAGLFAGPALVLASLIVFVVKNKIKLRYTPNFWGIVALCGTLALGGLFFKPRPENNLRLWLILVGLIIFSCALYLLLCSGMSGENRIFFAKCMMAVGLVLSAQIIVAIWRAGSPTAAAQKRLWFGWGVTNHIAMLLTFSIPMTFFLATKSRSPYFYIIAGMFQCAMMLLTFSRGCSVILALAFIPMTVFAGKKAANKKAFSTTVILLTLATGIVAFILAREVFDNFMEIWEKGLSGNGREVLYEEAWDLFGENPVFGVGVFFDYKILRPGVDTPVIFFHSTVLHSLAISGIIGFAGMLLHQILKYAVLIKSAIFRKDVFAYFALGALIMSGMYGMIDITYYTPYYLVTLFCLLAVMENLPEAQSESTVSTGAKRIECGINLKKVLLFVGIPLAIVSLSLMLGVSHNINNGLKLSPLDILVLPAALIILVPLHEVFHALGFILYSGVPANSIKFGILPKSRMLYCHCPLAMPAQSMLTPLLLPLIFCGFLPAVAAVASGSVSLMLVSALMLGGSCGDIAMVKNAIKARGKIIADMPDKTGFYVYEELN